MSHALDFLGELAGTAVTPIIEKDVRQLHALVLDGIVDEAGAYRSVPVAVSASAYSPPGPESVPVDMADFGRSLAASSVPSEDASASVSGLLAAAVAHTWFVTVHPFIDSNGRVARLLMNLMLMRYRYPIALLVECIGESLEEYEAAAEEQRETSEWAASLAQKFTKPERVRAENEYEVWKSAMELLRSHLGSTVDTLDEQYGLYRNVYLRNFGHLEFEKYSALRYDESAKRTWFLRIDFRRGNTTARYLFFFGHASDGMRGRCDVTLHVAREEPPNSFYYERLDRIGSSNVPDLAEIGYEMSQERFVIRMCSGRMRESRIEDFSKRLFEDVVERHFT